MEKLEKIPGINFLKVDGKENTFMDEKIRNRNRNLRTAFMVASILNQFVCAISSITNYVGNETFIIVYNIVSILLTGVSSTLAWWYNNSFTPEAKQSDEYMYQLKEYNKQVEEVSEDKVEFIEEEGE